MDPDDSVIKRLGALKAAIALLRASLARLRRGHRVQLPRTRPPTEEPIPASEELAGDGAVRKERGPA